MTYYMLKYGKQWRYKPITKTCIENDTSSLFCSYILQQSFKKLSK